MPDKSAPEPPTPRPAIRTVYQTTEPSDAHSIAVLLRGHGIDAWIDNELSAALEGIPIGAIPYVISVPAGQISEAGEIVRDALTVKSRRKKRGRSKRTVWILVAAWMIIPSIAGVLLYLLGLD